jgi:tetratricopeptide (TPR) repeat protein
LYNQGVYELNRGQVEQAISYFEKALKTQPEADHILYSLAAAHARLGQVAQALEELRQAIERREEYRIQARRDSDFTSLYSHPLFQELVGWEVIESPGTHF